MGKAVEDAEEAPEVLLFGVEGRSDGEEAASGDGGGGVLLGT